MRKNITLSGSPVMLQVVLESKVDNMPMEFMVVDPTRLDTAYQIRLCQLKKGEQSLYVRMPLSPVRAQLVLWEEGKPNTKDKELPYVRIKEVKKLPLPQRLDVALLRDKNVKSFLSFVEEFSVQAGEISAGGSIYTSKDDKFTIVYFDTIVSAQGKSLNTPARVNQNTGVIEISADKFRLYSVPMRMAILLHEFSHFWLNEDMNDETEADLNALAIYLGLGYPRLDAVNVFLNVFMGTPTNVNKERYEKIKAFINNFEQMSLSIPQQSAAFRLIFGKSKKGFSNFLHK